MQHWPSSDPFLHCSYLCSWAFNPYISTSDKCESIQSRVKRRVLLPRVAYFLFFVFFCFFFFFFFFSPAWTSRAATFHFGNRRVGGKKIERGGGNNRDFLIRHRSIFVTDRSLERKVRHTRKFFLFLQQRHYSAPKCAQPFAILL